MAQDLLAALGARIEAQLKTNSTRLRSIEDSVKAQVSANPPAPFTMLSDGTRQFGYAPASAVTTVLVPEPSAADSGGIAPSPTPPDAVKEAEIVSDSAAPIADLLSATARIFTTASAETKAVEPLAREADLSSEAVPAPEHQVFSNVSAYMEAVLAKPAVLAATVPESSSPVATTTVVADAVPASVAVPAPVTASARTVAESVSPGYTMLPDGTKQFGYAPTGTSVNPGVPNKTPPVPADFGVGATMRRRNVTSDTPITVSRVGDGLVFANFTDAEGTREIAFYPNQMDLLTAAP